MKGIKESNTIHFADIFQSTRRYSIPKFQRDYSWKKEQWDELWADILMLYKDEVDEHYMGYIVLLNQNNGVFDIIDGQQRLTTISLLILAVMEKIHEQVETDSTAIQRYEGLKRDYIGKDSNVDLTIQHKLILNRNNHSFFKKLIDRERIQRKITKPSNKRIKDCFDFFVAKIGEISSNTAELTKFIEFITRKLFFTQIEVTDELNAYRVFETLNARGIKLSSTDLLKNHLFRIIEGDKNTEIDVRADYLKAIEELWDEIVDTLGDEEFPDFLRAFWNGRNAKIAEKKSLFKLVSETITDTVQAVDLVKSLNSIVYSYKGITSPSLEHFTDPEVNRYLSVLKLFNIKQPIPLLLVAYETFGETEKFKKVLRDCVILSFRYNFVCGLNPNVLQDAYHKIATKLHTSGKYDNYEIEKIYPDDEVFKKMFLKLEFTKSTSDVAKERYILCKLESKLDDKERLPSNADTIEHIMPKDAVKTWGVDQETFSENINKLGNHTLATASEQNRYGTKEFRLKKPELAKSSYKLSRRISQFSTWDSSSISDNQGWMAEQAKSIWGITFPKRKK